VGYVWADSYRQVRSSRTLVTFLFAAFLLAENALALYYYPTSASMPAAAMRAMMTPSMLETVGLALLAYVTWEWRPGPARAPRSVRPVRRA